MKNIFCDKCGKPIPSDSGFCQYCGRVIPQTFSNEIEIAIESKNEHIYNTLEHTLMKGFMLIEDKEWKKADKCFDVILEQDIQCSDAYIGKLLIELRLANKGDLFETYCNLEKNNNFKRAYKFADNSQKEPLKSYIKQNRVNLKNKKQKQKKIKKRIIIASLSIVLAICVGVGGFLGYKNILNPMIKYNNAKSLLKEEKYKEAIKIFEKLNEYSDSKTQANAAKYQLAKNHITKKQYKEAITILDTLQNYNDSDELLIETKYTYAVNLYTEKKYADSAICFSDIKGYKDSVSYLQKNELYWRTKGNIIKLGSYEQDGNHSNGKEPIEWIIIDAQSNEDSVLLISKYCLEFKKYCEQILELRGDSYYEVEQEIDWLKSDLRKWLNDTFYNNSFTNAEKSKIVPINIIYSIDTINDDSKWITDNVSLLTAAEAKNLFNEKVILSTSATVEAYLNHDYKYKLSAAQKESKNTISWWLRSVESKKFLDTVNGNENSIIENSTLGWSPIMAVRPVIRISVEY